jgi:Glycosyl transferase family 11
MIGFSLLGSYGRLGNQLFQYAYLRTMATRLGTTFYCPHWEGDDIFDLNDQEIRSHVAPSQWDQHFNAYPEVGFSIEATQIQDGTHVEGFFQSEKYFPNRITWYKFKESIRQSVLQKVAADAIDLSRSVSISLRLDQDYEATREYFPLYNEQYYLGALKRYPDAAHVLVFADRIDLAKPFLKRLARRHNVYFVSQFNAHEQLFLMTQCRLGNVITNSTFAWWGAYLNENPGAITTSPLHWTRPGTKQNLHSIMPDAWVKHNNLNPVFDHFYIWCLLRPHVFMKKVKKRVARLVPKRSLHKQSN